MREKKKKKKKKKREGENIYSANFHLFYMKTKKFTYFAVEKFRTGPRHQWQEFFPLKRKKKKYTKTLPKKTPGSKKRKTTF